MSRHSQQAARGGASIVMSFVGVLLISKFLWGWVVPDLLPGAVDDGLIVAAIGWGTALKLGVVAAAVAAVVGRGGVRMEHGRRTAHRETPSEQPV
jgi:hypothetical protein